MAYSNNEPMHKYDSMTYLRKAGHVYHDIIIRYKASRTNKDIGRWRKSQYKWLSKKLGIDRRKCHFKRFDKSTLKTAIDILALEYANNPKMIDYAELFENGKKKFQDATLSKAYRKRYEKRN